MTDDRYYEQEIPDNSRIIEAGEQPYTVGQRAIDDVLKNFEEALNLLHSNPYIAIAFRKMQDKIDGLVADLRDELDRLRERLARYEPEGGAILEPTYTQLDEMFQECQQALNAEQGRTKFFETEVGMLNRERAILLRRIDELKSSGNEHVVRFPNPKWIEWGWRYVANLGDARNTKHGVVIDFRCSKDLQRFIDILSRLTGYTIRKP